MRVDAKVPLTPASFTPAARQASALGARFAPGTEPSRPGAAAPLAGLATVDALLALQGDEDPGERRRRHARRGHDLLDGLDRLKAALLGGRVPAGELQRLAARLAAGAGLSGDPRLDEIVGEIELRAAVELAKLRVG